MLETIKHIVKKVPIVSHSYRFIRNAFSGPPQPLTTQRIFTNIYKQNTWRSTQSVSGLGSEPKQTERLVSALPLLFKELDISTMLDVPCGDFNWMKTVDLSGIKYLGADIVKDLIRRNEKLRSSEVDFVCLNLISDPLPKVDLIFCRDCLVHLSYADIFRALRNICESDSTYLLTTTFPKRSENRDISTGDWRPLNLEVEPFLFPAPLRILVEGCTEDDGLYEDKSLGLWRISELGFCLTDRTASAAQADTAITLSC